MGKSSSGLVAYAEGQLGRGYWWGCFGQTASEALLSQKKEQYPYDYASYGSECLAQYGQKVHDCSGLIKGYLWSDTPDSEPQYRATQDVNVAGLYGCCIETGSISAIPEIAGLLVFVDDLSHVGVYIGNGEVIEAMGHRYGVVKTKLAQRNFTLWGKLCWITYPSVADEQKTEDTTAITSDVTENVHAEKTINDYAITALSAINGTFGNGQERIDNLSALGYDAAKVQKIVNALLS